MKLLGKHTDTENLQFLYISDILVLLHSLIEIFYTLNTSFQNDPVITKNKGLSSLWSKHMSLRINWQADIEQSTYRP